VDVLIIGAGLIGLASAYELARRGASVCVLEAGEPGKAASWAAAGMLTPHTEEHGSSILEEFGAESLRRYPALARELRERVGVDVRFQPDGVLRIAYDDDALRELSAHAAHLAVRGIRARMLDAGCLRGEEPAVAGHALGALLLEEEGQVDNRRLVRALHAACTSAGVRIEAGTEVEALEADARRVRGVRTSHGFIAASVVLNAAGAQAGLLAGVPAHARMPVTPIKGQMLALGMPRGLVRRVLWVPGVYLVPRIDGRLLIGATVEQAEFDVRVTARGVHILLDATLRAMPALQDLALVETWAGVRPASADGLPFIGATALDGYFVACGHYRYGILLAPATACLLADAVEGKTSAYADAFSPLRATSQEPGARIA
jgi:glycine oxidase